MYLRAQSPHRVAIGGKELFHDPWRELETEDLIFLYCRETTV